MKSKYAALKKVLNLAFAQASEGKGKERHASGEKFEEQPICQIQRGLGSADFALGQAIKKCYETHKLKHNPAKIAELLGAINYIAAAVIILQEQEGQRFMQEEVL